MRQERAELTRATHGKAIGRNTERGARHELLAAENLSTEN